MLIKTQYDQNTIQCIQCDGYNYQCVDYYSRSATGCCFVYSLIDKDLRRIKEGQQPLIFDNLERILRREQPNMR